jgi:hypothetical protein
VIAGIAQGILEDPTASFLMGLIVVAVIGFAIRNYAAKRKE